MIQFHAYGFILGIAIVAGWWQAQKMARKEGISEQLFDRLGIIILLTGIVGARTYHVIDLWDYYQNDLARIFMLWQGGLGIWGGLMGGAFGLWLWARRAGLSRLMLLDILATALPLSQAIGRWGNYVNQELYGPPTSLPWGIFIDSQQGYFHPLFFYESLLNLGLFFILRGLGKPSSARLSRATAGKRGMTLGVYLIGYGCIRFVLEFLRIDPWRMVLLTTAQWVSVVAIGIGIWLVQRVHYKPYV